MPGRQAVFRRDSMTNRSAGRRPVEGWRGAGVNAKEMPPLPLVHRRWKRV